MAPSMGGVVMDDKALKFRGRAWRSAPRSKLYMAELPALAIMIGPSGYPLIAAAKELQAAGCAPGAIIELELNGRVLSGRVDELAQQRVKDRGRQGMGLHPAKRNPRKRKGQPPASPQTKPINHDFAPHQNPQSLDEPS